MFRVSIGSLALLFLAVIATAAPGGTLPQMDSAMFEHGYEMDMLPTDEDKDENSTPDFHLYDSSGGSSSVAGGIMTLSSPGTSDGAYFFRSSAPGEIWTGKAGFNPGFTIEARIKVVSDDDRPRGPFGIYASPEDGPEHTFLNVQENGQSWGAGDPAVSGSLGTNDNTDDYHVFRVAAEAGPLFQVWRDGVMVGENLGYGDLYPEDVFCIGDIGGGNGGTVLVDYVRFTTTGAYAPIPEPATLTMLVIGFISLCVWRQHSWK